MTTAARSSPSYERWALFCTCVRTGCTSSSSHSEPQPSCRKKANFLLWWSRWRTSWPPNLVHTSSLSALGKLFKTGSSAVAVLSHALLVCSWRLVQEARSSLTFVLNLNTYAGSSSDVRGKAAPLSRRCRPLTQNLSPIPTAEQTHTEERGTRKFCECKSLYSIVDQGLV